MSDSKPKPFLKWAGGKTQLLPELLKHVPTFDTYYEPFVGAGALFFELQPRKAVIADVNEELINCYECLAKSLDLVISILDNFSISSEFFYELRAADRSLTYSKKFKEWKAARLIYLNKTCFNGLYRVNSKGEFNTPWGKYKKPKLYDFKDLSAVNTLLYYCNILIQAQNFNETLNLPQQNDFVYCDPPYDVVSSTSDFTGYAVGGFTRTNQIELKLKVDVLTKKGVKCLVSNADTDFIRDLWRDYEIITVQAKRNINSKADKRGAINEVLIRNY